MSNFIDLLLNIISTHSHPTNWGMKGLSWLLLKLRAYLGAYQPD